jgi:hypothetical protein
VCNKPVLWEYYDVPSRYRLYKVFSALIKLRIEEELFETDDYSLNVAGAMKSIHLNSSGMNATILGNFDLVSNSITAGFQHTGTWYEYYTGESIDVTDVNISLTLTPGEYRIYTDIQLEMPDIPVNDDIRFYNLQDKNLLFPNPTQGTIQINTEVSGLVQFELIDLAGNKY